MQDLAAARIVSVWISTCSCGKARSQRSWYPHRLRHTWESVKKQASLQVIWRWRAAAVEILLHGFPKASKNSVIYPIKDVIRAWTLKMLSILVLRSSSGSNSTKKNSDHISLSFYHRILFFLYCLNKDDKNIKIYFFIKSYTETTYWFESCK